MSIASTLARKIQYHRQNDTNTDEKPHITVRQFAISPNDAEKFQEKGLEMGIKFYKDGDEKTAKNIYELAALTILARDEGISLTEWFEKTLKNNIHENSLISKDQIEQQKFAEEERLKIKLKII